MCLGGCNNTLLSSFFIIFEVEVELGRDNHLKLVELRIEFYYFLSGIVINAEGAAGDDAVAFLDCLGDGLVDVVNNLFIYRAPTAAYQNPVHSLYCRLLMCLTVPRKVERVEEDRALMQDGRWVKTTMVGKVKAGDFLLVQANLAVEKVSAHRVREMKETMLDE